MTKIVGLKISTDVDAMLSLHEVDADNFSETYNVLGIRMVEVVSLGEHGDLFVDEEGLFVESPELNVRASLLARAFGRGETIVGDALLVGPAVEGSATTVNNATANAVHDTTLRLQQQREPQNQGRMLM